MPELISPLRVVDIALVWIIAETAVQWLIPRWRNPIMQPQWLVTNALAGLMLLLALRSVLADWNQAWFLVFMSLAGLAHIAEIAARPSKR
jgi:hypothetical protein